MLLTPEQTAELQRTELEIFRIFVEVCKRLNIKYYLVAGTLLGAVRHQGFIPWDDDIDVGIMREDYDRFMKEAVPLLPDHIFLQIYSTDLEYPHVFAKLRDTNTAFIECTVRDNKMNHGVFIDIFPLDSCDLKVRNSVAFRLKEKIYLMRASSLMKNYKPDFRRRLIRQCCKLICPDAHRALYKLEKLYRSMPAGKYLVNFSGIYGAREIMPTGWYGDGVFVRFEGMDVVAPKEFDKWLSQVYGDYMKLPPEEKRVTHHLTEVIDVGSSYRNYLKE